MLSQLGTLQSEKPSATSILLFLLRAYDGLQASMGILGRELDRCGLVVYLLSLIKFTFSQSQLPFPSLVKLAINVLF